MSFKESTHFHQSDKLNFLSPEYLPIRFDNKNNKTYGAISWDGKWKVRYQKKIPKIGGYVSISENIYGNPTYCPNATRNHKKHLKMYGSTPHLVYFDSEGSAFKAGFRRCKVCTL